MAQSDDIIINSNKAIDSSCKNTIFNGIFPQDVKEKYQLKEVLGQGTFGIVRRCQDKDGNNHALKTILKSKVPDPKVLKREIEIMRQVHHPHIIRLFDVFEDDKNIFLVTELCTGGELYDRVVEKTVSNDLFSEYDAARITRNILSAVEFIHSKGVAHRDLKPENFLLEDESDEAAVKIIDFGLSRFHNDKGLMKSRVGTIYYVAPEVLSAPSYTTKCDVWSVGVVTYVLLCGYPPFNAGNERLTYDLVTDGDLKFPSPAWDHISPEAICFIQRLMTRDPDKRPTATEALQDPWLNQEKVQPQGFDKKVTFLPRKYHSTESNEDKQVKYTDTEKQRAFQKFLKRFKNRKE
ncbi:calcium/calmodulin-dependent protein kinase-like protein [Nitzschia inconspicua]|uniref:non-specific serine/threonine protein kinase n=1 Tax=Nitzschia inconspicua TaxID=303405 RepID=A0A9K3PKN7_9STRA|nr:calcium/calmodulin-dependent protein kinase-like protein [Nitzschia inconspicua]